MLSEKQISAALVIALSVVTLSKEHKLRVDWYAPFLSGGGYSSEATTFVFALSLSNATGGKANNFSFLIAHHGDSYNHNYVNGLTIRESRLLTQYMIGSQPKTPSKKPFVVSICHSEPGAWHAPMPKYYTNQCPPADATYRIGRTMFETDKIPNVGFINPNVIMSISFDQFELTSKGWVNRLNYLDEIWVPTGSCLINCKYYFYPFLTSLPLI